jgi:hypothetical protein
MPQDEHTDLFDIENPPNKTDDSIISDFMSFEKYFCEIFRGNLKEKGGTSAAFHISLTS